MPDIKLNDLFYFVQVVDNRGFAAAARALGIPKSTLSKRVAELEKDLGIRLIQRTTRHFGMTEAGEDFHRHAAAAILEAEAAEDVVKRRLAEPRGLVRISASMATIQMALADLLPELAKLYPKIQIALVATSRYVDLVQEGIDLAIRAHSDSLPDSVYIQHRLGYAPNYLVASPSYLAVHSNPDSPEDINSHFGIVPENTGTEIRWSLRDGSGNMKFVQPMPKLFTDDPFMIVNAALAGMAIANIPHGLAQPHIESGRLIRLLPSWEMEGASTTLLMPYRRGQLPSIRVVVDFLAERMVQSMALR